MTIVAAGITVHQALSAADALAAGGIAAQVIDLYSVKPVDTQGLRAAGIDAKAIEAAARALAADRVPL